MSRTEAVTVGNCEVEAFARNQITQHLELLGISPERPREVRLLGGQLSRTLFGLFTSAKTLADAVVPWVGKANIHVGVNSSNPIYLSRANNTLVEAANRKQLPGGADLLQAPITLIDSEIEEVSVLYLDIDSKRLTKQSDCATDEEVAPTKAARDQIAADLGAVGIDGIKLMSGNGANLLVLVKPGASAAMAGRIKAVLRAFATRYGNAHVGIDVKVSNPSRIMRLGGTLNLKVAGPGRPQRYAHFEHTGPAPKPCDLEVLEKMLGLPAQSTLHVTAGGGRMTGNCVTTDEYDGLLQAWADATVSGNRHELALGLAAAARKTGWSKADVIVLVQRLTTDAQDEESQDRLRVVEDTYAEPDLTKLAGWSKLEQLQLDRADFPSLTTFSTPPAENMASQLVEMGSVLPLIRTEFGEFMIVVPLDGGRVEPTKISSGMFMRWLRLRYWETYAKAASQQALSAAAGILEAMCWKEKKSSMFNRVGQRADGTIVLDLCDDKGQVIAVDGNGWRVESEPKPMFYRHAHQMELQVPTAGGNPWSILNYVPLKNDDDKIIFVVTTIAALLPSIPQPVVVFYGPQGSAKTTVATIRRALIDPSHAPVMPLTRALSELVQMLNHNYLPILDNVSVVTLEQGNLLCQVSTGAGQSKRKLFTDDEDVVCQFKRQTTITCLSIPRTESDFIDRALLLPLERVSAEERKEEQALLARFETQKTEILGGMLDTLARAINLYPTVTPTRLPRMADFGRWATAIAMALGYTEAQFTEVLWRVINRQVTSIVDDDMVAAAIVWLANRTAATSKLSPSSNSRHWEGTATRLLDRLATAPGVNDKSKRWPKEAAVLGKKLVQLQTPLAQLGIIVERSKSGERLWRIEATKY